MKKIIPYVLTLLSLTTPVLAQNDLNGCLLEHQSCVKECLNLEGTGTQSTCVAQCAGTEAKCAGAIGLEASEPYLRKKADQLEKLLNDFFQDILPVPKQKTPTPPTSGPTDT